MERCPGIPRRLKVVHRVVRQPELELPARHRLTNCVVLPFELISNGRADEVSTVGVEAVADHEIHASEIDETEVDRNFLAVGGLRSQLVNVCHIRTPFPSDWEGYESLSQSPGASNSRGRAIRLPSVHIAKAKCPCRSNQAKG